MATTGPRTGTMPDSATTRLPGTVNARPLTPPIDVSRMRSNGMVPANTGVRTAFSWRVRPRML